MTRRVRGQRAVAVAVLVALAVGIGLFVGLWVLGDGGRDDPDPEGAAGLPSGADTAPPAVESSWRGPEAIGGDEIASSPAPVRPAGSSVESPPFGSPPPLSSG